MPHAARVQQVQQQQQATKHGALLRSHGSCGSVALQSEDPAERPGADGSPEGNGAGMLGGACLIMTASTRAENSSGTFAGQSNGIWHMGVG